MATLFPTISDLLAEIRDDLDEAENSATNFWSTSFLLGRLNRGLREVWQAARETHENWFTRVLRSDGDPLTIYGRTYDPSQLALEEGRDTLILPPDFFEMRSIAPVIATDQEPFVVLTFTDHSSVNFRELHRQTGGAMSGTYYVDVERRETGPVLLVAPTVGLATPGDVELHYVFQPHDFAQTDSLENSGFTRTMLDAAVAYAVLAAREKEDKTDGILRAERTYGRKLQLVTRHAGPRQSQDPELVDGGWLEDGI